jgi:hypothetical protein
MKSYLTESEAINDLRSRGYTLDFNKVFQSLLHHKNKSLILMVGKAFIITEVHRFEGESNPDDEAIVYAIQSQEGYKGFLLNGYGVSADSSFDEVVDKLTINIEA